MLLRFFDLWFYFVHFHTILVKEDHLIPKITQIILLARKDDFYHDYQFISLSPKLPERQHFKVGHPKNFWRDRNDDLAEPSNAAFICNTNPLQTLTVEFNTYLLSVRMRR